MWLLCLNFNDLKEPFLKSILNITVCVVCTGQKFFKETNSGYTCYTGKPYLYEIHVLKFIGTHSCEKLIQSAPKWLPTAGKPFVCDVNQKALAHKCKFNTHLAIHKPFLCHVLINFHLMYITSA